MTDPSLWPTYQSWVALFVICGCVGGPFCGRTLTSPTVWGILCPSSRHVWDIWGILQHLGTFSRHLRGILKHGGAPFVSDTKETSQTHTTAKTSDDDDSDDDNDDDDDDDDGHHRYFLPWSGSVVAYVA